MTDGRLVCAFMTDEDSTETPGVYPAYDYGVHSNVKAVVSDDWGTTWSISTLVISQRPQERFASWSGLCRLLDDGLLCAFTDGPWGEVFYESVKCTRAKLVDALPIEDHFNHLNLDGTPFMWGLLGDWQTTTTASHGKVLLGTHGSFGDTMAFRGESSWTSYSVQVEVKMAPTSVSAGLCLRVNQSWPGDYACYQCYVDDSGARHFGLRVLFFANYTWWWQTLQEVSLSGFDRSKWHTIKVQASGGQFDCYLDNVYKFTVNNGMYTNGAIGLRVTQGSALFDNVKVLAVP